MGREEKTQKKVQDEGTVRQTPDFFGAWVYCRTKYDQIKDSLPNIRFLKIIIIPEHFGISHAIDLHSNQEEKRFDY